MSRCPFCKLDPFHYVSNGCGMEAVAVTCCDLGVALYSRHKPTRRAAFRVAHDMRSYSPRRKARAMKALREYGLREPSRAERRAERLIDAAIAQATQQETRA